MRRNNSIRRLIARRAFAFELLECRRVLSFGIGIATAEPSPQGLFQFELRNGIFGSDQLVNPIPDIRNAEINSSLRYGFGTDRGAGPDQIIVGDWSGTGFTSVGAVRQDFSLKPSGEEDARLMFLLDNDRDTTHGYIFKFGFRDENGITGTPVVGNFDGLAGDDIAVVKNLPDALLWQIVYAKAEPESPYPVDRSVLTAEASFRFGLPGDTPLAGRFDNDAFDDLVVVRNINGQLHWLFHLTGQHEIAGYPADSRIVNHDATFIFGVAGDLPLIGDWNGDGQDSIGIISVTEGQDAVWTLQELRFDGTQVSGGSSQSVTFGRVQPGQENVFFSGKWANNYFKGTREESLVDGPLVTGNRWSVPDSWSSGSPPRPGDTVVIDQRADVKIEFDNSEFAGTLISRNGINVTGGTLTLQGNSSIVDLNVESGTVVLGGSSNVSILTVNGGNVVFQDNSSVGTIVVNSGSILFNTAVQPSSLTLSGGVTQVNAPLGTGTNGVPSLDISINGGVLRVGDLVRINTFSMSDGQLILEYSHAEAIDYLWPSTTPLNLTGGSILSAAIPVLPTGDITANFRLTNNITLNGSVRFGNEILMPDGESSADQLIERQRNSYLRLEGVISGPGEFRKVGLGSVYPTGENTYDGLTIVEDGEIVISTSNSLGSTVGGTILRGGIINSVPKDQPPIFHLEPLLFDHPRSVLSLRYGTTWAGPVTVGELGGAIYLEPSSGDRVNRLTQLEILGNTAILLVPPYEPSHTNKAAEIDWPISGTGSLAVYTRLPGYEVRLASQAALYTGATTIRGTGTALIDHPGAIPVGSDVVVNSGSTLVNRSGQAFRPQSLTGGGTFDLGGESLILDLAANSQFAGALIGDGDLIKLGEGVLTVSGANSYSGTTSLEAGTLLLQGGNAVPDTSPITVSGGTLDFNNSDETIASLTSTGSVRLGNGVVRVIGDFTSDGELDAGTGTLEFIGGLGSNQSLAITSGQLNDVLHSGVGTLGIARDLSLGGTLINRAGTININDSTVSTSGFVMEAGIITGGQISSSTSFDLRSGSVSTALTGSGNLSKTTGGTLTLSGDNSYAGTTAVNNGTLLLQGGNAIPDSSSVVVSGATLDFNNSNETIGSLSSAGVLRLGNGVVRIAGDFISLGELDAGAGTVEFISSTGSPKLLTAAADPFHNVRHSGTGTLRITGDVTLNGTLTNRAGTIDIVGTVSTNQFVMEAGIVSGGQISSSTLFDLQSGSVSATLSGAGALEKATDGTVNISGDNTYTGATTVRAGTLLLQGANAIPTTSAIDVFSGTLDFNGYDVTITSLKSAGAVRLGDGVIKLQGDFTSRGEIDAAGSTLEFTGSALSVQTILALNNPLNNILQSGSGTLRLAGDLSLNGSLRNRGGTIDINNASVSTGWLVLESGSVIDTIGGGVITSEHFFELQSGSVSAALSGLGELFKWTDGTVVLSGRNSYSDSTYIFDGVLLLHGGHAIPDASEIVILDGTLDFNDSNETVASIINAGSLFLGNGTVRLSADFISGGVMDPESGTLEFIGGNSEQWLAWFNSQSFENLFHHHPFNFHHMGTSFLKELILNHVEITNNGLLSNVIHNGDGTLRFSGNLSVEGAITNQAGTLDINGAAVLADRFIMETGSVIDGAGGGKLSSTTSFNLQGGTVLADLAGAGDLRKTSSGTVSLQGRNSYTGSTTIDEGLLVLDSERSWVDGSILTINRSGILELNGRSIIARDLSGSGSIELGNGILTIDVPDFSTFGGTISGHGDLIKEGLGDLAILGTNDFQGNVLIKRGGVLLLKGFDILGKENDVWIEDDAELLLWFGSQTVRSLQGQGTLALLNGWFQIEHGATSFEFQGEIHGHGLIEKAGDGTLELSGKGDFSGRVVVQSGTLQANGQFENANVIVERGANVQGNGELGDLTIADGGTFLPGNSPGQFTVRNLDLQSGSTLLIEIGGPLAGGQYDQVFVKEHASLSGNIIVTLTEGFFPRPGDIFDLVLFTTFSGNPNLSLPIAGSERMFTTQILPASYRLQGLTIAPAQESREIDTATYESTVESASTNNEAAMLVAAQAPTGRGENDWATESEFQELGNSEGPDVSEWKNRPQVISPPDLQASTDTEDAAKAIDAALTEGLTFESPFVASDMKPITIEMLETIGMPAFHESKEQGEFPPILPHLVVAGGAATTLLGVLSTILAAFSLARTRTRDNPKMTELTRNLGQVQKPSNPSQQNPAIRREEVWTID